VGGELFPRAVAGGDFPDAHGRFLLCRALLDQPCLSQTIDHADQMIGDRLKPMDVAVDRNRIEGLSCLIKHSFRNLRRSGNRPRTVQESLQKVFVDAFLAQQEVTQRA
jgi:hypothetical protein